MQSLPSQRHFLTCLVNTISEIPSSSHRTSNDTSPPPVAYQPPRAASSSPLEAIRESHGPLLLTLHVLFPNLLLPALDLLDRRLVTRLRSSDIAHPLGGNFDDTNSASGEATGISSGIDSIFLVRSIATTISRRRRDLSLSSRSYIVHLSAWNCSCASFTLDAFPSHPVSVTPGSDTTPQSETGWSFGGLSLDGLGASTGDVPCCKHLLACLVTEKWPGMLGQYVENRMVTRDELAGIMAEI
ncbi:hypothetical protein BGZ63DRAFT_396297 [Mariannaea sp. PMI_226]|nr:hypothetical protein BGZ63DRAFT_396297 [Mariannaea sp. PMI_226]